MIYVGRPIPFLLIGNGLGEGPLTARGSLIAASGDRAEAQIVLTGRLPRDHTDLDRFTATLDTGSLRPGQYRLDVTLTAEAGGPSVSSSIAIVAR